MPTWSHFPPADELRGNMQLVRTPRDGSLVGIVTSDDLIGTNTHFWGGRTTPCEPPSCPACDAGCPTRWHAYLSFLRLDIGTQQLLELTAQASIIFSRYVDAHDTLRGCHFKSYRTGTAKNSKIEVLTKPADLTKLILPDPPDILAVLAMIWRINPATWNKDGAVNRITKYIANGAKDRVAKATRIPGEHEPHPNGKRSKAQ